MVQLWWTETIQSKENIRRNGRVECLHTHHFSLKELWASMASSLLGLTLMACVLLGMGAHPLAVAASTVLSATVETAVDQYLVSMPGDYYTVGTISALKRLIASRKPLLIDVRNPSEYKEGHIPGAINIPLKDLELRLDVLPTDQDLVLYCSTGYRSAMGVMALHLLGFTHVRGFPPSLAGWEAAGEPVSRSEPPGRAQA
jgi:rhodanese-related sulfurtransferase